jgi:hypothetical protein
MADLERLLAATLHMKAIVEAQQKMTMSSQEKMEGKMEVNMTPKGQKSGIKEASRKRQLLGNGLLKHVKAASVGNYGRGTVRGGVLYLVWTVLAID